MQKTCSQSVLVGTVDESISYRSTRYVYYDIFERDSQPVHPRKVLLRLYVMKHVLSHSFFPPRNRNSSSVKLLTRFSNLKSPEINQRKFINSFLRNEIDYNLVT
jgi:hypothetical protein